MSAESPRLGFLRTTAFRVTLLHLGLTLLGTLALAGVVWWATVGYATRQAAQQIERDTGLLLQAGALSGLAGMRLSVEARLAADRSGLEHYLLAAPDGARIAGNLASAPLQPGWRSLGLEHRGAPEGPPAPLMALVTRLPGGGTLVVGRDLTPAAQLEERLWAAAGWVGGAALLLGLLGGLLVGRGVARRAAAMGAALDQVQAGDLGRRLPVAGTDEFDRLARRINATLDRLETAMVALRQVTDDIAHDLRTPLSRLRQRLEVAARPGNADVDGAAGWRVAAETAIGECDAILEIFAALLRIAQVESGAALRQGFAPFDLSAALEAVAEAYAPAAEERGQTLTTAIPPGIMVPGDRTLLTQALANLAENAVRHGRPGGQVRVALAPQAAGGVAVRVEDDGPGIPPAERERVFRRFVRLDAARSTPGSGLGLALVKAVATLHGGSVALEDSAPTAPQASRAAGPGLRVMLRLPG